ncbi:Gfo/Idh/MocA family protein [Tuwongella immobilis]|uniref:Gfo/Idh/MocA-like oxidoreductase N-terminal domain-containing protein n=1 Tax=Tuwongella immobilis TaxID=692036 RepID=A0A6C2YWM6_9BACT|nr:Gfo/Idh/MocA family oxidoreductase [Tuwongella immobilis]VIP05262.1 oxidoreductase : Oxidoreductase OS=Gracilibacillus halophilus YIM-C55.5 GN=J416_00279 PE=4 SV=1: GFO_IDH_MocA: GFO_IDH_MocA_C [Tuwongella immobilis]VTS07880.1 oxidoreductase : Oxidoreductase OS=Gracilibacillus halophilus YIM-C55.5 GN=J416_00279 PE=4 SV=1: GFO_IDH_MocA: GFO_IDH_MocA_C [Tuwongella immobilis]
MMSSPTPRLRWGILGAAKINQRLVPAFQKSATADLRAIASRSDDKAKQAAAEAGIARGVGSYEALLEDPDIDAIYIPLPNHLHAEWTRKAADAGKHILCEKPLCPDAADAAALIAYCRAKNVRLMDGFMWPHHPRTAKIRQMLDAGAIGKVQRVNTAFTFNLNPLNDSNIRMHRNMGGGALLDVGCYCVYGIRWAFQAEPVKVYAEAKLLNDVDVSLSAMLWFADGRTAFLDTGFVSPLRGWLEIVGESGTIHIPDLWLPSADAAFTLTSDEQPAQTITVPGHDQIVCMLDDFAAAVHEQREAWPNPDEAVKSLKVLNAIDRSARSGQIEFVN